MKYQSVNQEEMKKWFERMEPGDMQALIIRGYRSLKAACYIFMKITDTQKAQQFLKTLQESITKGGVKRKHGLEKEDTAMHLAFTSSGLRRFLPENVMQTFGREFLEGMTYPGEKNNTIFERSALLGDTRNNDPKRWYWGNQEKPVDCVLMLYARDQSKLEELKEKKYYTIRNGVDEVFIGDTFEFDPGNLKEHFGFMDGISQPVLRGIDKTADEFDTSNLLNPGEVILGYENEYGNYSPSPYIENGDDCTELPPFRGHHSRKDLGKNGTYMVFRQMEQHVEKFWRFQLKHSKEPGATQVEKAIKLASKMVGRWPQGQPLVQCPDAPFDDPSVDINEFQYSKSDQFGIRCPFGAHIRRTNPRDQVHTGANGEPSIELSKKHRMLRRGRLYGEPLDEKFDVQKIIEKIEKVKGDEERDCQSGDNKISDENKNGSEFTQTPIIRGLHFICMVSDIGRQFEFVQNVWANTATFAGLCDQVDPLISPRPTDGQPQCHEFTTPQKTIRNRYQEVPEFTTVVGGGYFFMPGIKALNYILNSKK